MAKFIFHIEETVVQDFEIEADTLDEALELGDEKYNSGEFVLEPGELVEAKGYAIDESTSTVSEYIDLI